MTSSATSNAKSPYMSSFDKNGVRFVKKLSFLHGPVPLWCEKRSTDPDFRTVPDHLQDAVELLCLSPTTVRRTVPLASDSVPRRPLP